MDGVSNEKDIRKTPDFYHESAAKGNAQSQAQLGRMYLQGVGVDRDYKLALAWYQKSAEQGNGEAQADLGHMYEKGLGVDPDIQKALAWYKKSIAQGNARGQVLLGDLYLNGSGVDQSYRKALACYQKSAEQGKDPESSGLALIRLGAMYFQGRGVEKDLRKGFELYLQAAKLGNAEAQRCVGAMYRDGVGVERNHKKALVWFQKSAKENRAPADSAMGDILRDGLFVEKNIPEAMKWYGKAAAKGDRYAKGELLKLQHGGAGQGNPQALAEVANADRSHAKLQVEEKAAKKSDQRIVPRRSRQARKVFAPRTRPYLFSAIAIIGLSLVLAFVDFIKNPDNSPESMEPAAMKAALAPQPGPPAVPSVPQEILEPLPATPIKLNADRSSLKPGKKASLPIDEASQAPSKVDPVVPLLRREYRSLDEKEISEMLAAKNMFDAERNPGGDFQHQYETRNAGGLSLILDRSTNLVWMRQRNLVKMNLTKTISWIESLNHVRYGGIKGWRLPTVEEAASLLENNTGAGKKFLAAVFGEGIKVIWTGDLFMKSGSWVVDLQNGMIKSAKSKSRLMTLMVSSDPDSAGE